jgi:molecular chaperone DnaK
VIFDIDANGILSVAAKDKATARQQSIRIEGSGGLAKGEIERMVRDAEAHASEDRARREQIEKHNALDSLIYQAEKTLAENGEKIPAEDKQAVEAAVADARKDLDSGDLAKLDAAHQRVERALHKVAEALYKAQAPQGAAAPGAQAPGGAPGGSAEGDVVDAEYSEEKSNG